MLQNRTHYINIFLQIFFNMETYDVMILEA